MLAIAALGALLIAFSFFVGLVLGRLAPSQAEWERRRKKFRLIRGEVNRDPQ